MKNLLGWFVVPLVLLFGSDLKASAAQTSEQDQTGTLEKMIVTTGDVVLNLDLNRLSGIDSSPAFKAFRFGVKPDSGFVVLIFDNLVRGPEPGSMELLGGNAATLPAPLNAVSNRFVIEKTLADNAFDLVMRDVNTGFVFFNIVGNQYEYDASAHSLRCAGGRLLVSTDLARQLSRPADAGTMAGTISIDAKVVPIEVTKFVNGAVQSAVLPARNKSENPNDPTSVPGPDVIVGDLPAMDQFGTDGSRVALAVATTSCNNGTVDLNWFALPEVDHPVIPQNLYRLTTEIEITRFEQIGQSWLKHAFTALTQNACGFGCNGVGGPHLGVGCSDPYSSSLNGGQSRLGSRAWVNPFTGAYPSNSCNHGSHSHDDTMHRLIVNISDLTGPLPATYYAEAQYVTPHEYAWCQSHPGQCNMYNNASYRQFTVNGTPPSFTYSAVGSTVRMAPALTAWTGATINTIEPAPGVDGRAFVAYRVVPAGDWVYEYAILNQNLDRGIQSFLIPLGCGTTLTAVGFHAPANQAGISEDGTFNNAGYSNAPWTVVQNPNFISWSSETLAQNQNANALRWGTLYNFRFHSNRPPQMGYAVVGFYKTGAPITVPIQVPSGAACTVGGRK